MTGRVVGQAKRFVQEMTTGVKRTADVMGQAVLEGLKQELAVMLPRVQQVMRQARARVLEGDTRVEGKLVNPFEPTTEIIRKGKASKPTEFGKLVKIQGAEHQMIISYEVYATRPPRMSCTMRRTSKQWDAQPDHPVGIAPGCSASRERRWGGMGGVLGSFFGLGSALIAVYIQGARWTETPYPAFFAQRQSSPTTCSCWPD
jgi:hypothetical protein